MTDSLTEELNSLKSEMGLPITKRERRGHHRDVGRRLMALADGDENEDKDANEATHR